MVNILIFITALVLIIPTFVAFTFFVSSNWEKENRAAALGGLQFFLMLGLTILFFYLTWTGFFKTTLGILLLISGLVVVAFASFQLMRKSGRNPKALEGTEGSVVGEVKRFDERDMVFSRNDYLRPGTKEYEAFYKKRPELEEIDAKRRARGGPLGQFGKIDKPHEEANIAAIISTGFFTMQMATPDKLTPPTLFRFRDYSPRMSPREATERIKGHALNLGADLVGITEINQLWIYSNRGMAMPTTGEAYGKEIEVKHKYAIIFATEMSSEMVATAPHTTGTIETMRNYAKGAYVSSQLAGYIANLGHPAEAHHLMHYDMLLVPMAVDAGLGELGRHGYLITKEFGPRIRLAAVTTDIPMIPDKPVDIGVKDFCDICKKCAVCCPSRSIPVEDPTEVNGTLRWKLNAETCFEYWGKIGSDCNVCMRVCPWSHERTFPHEVIVELVSRNMTARRLFMKMDDLFYGKKPKSKSPPSWARFNGVFE